MIMGIKHQNDYNIFFLINLMRLFSHEKLGSNEEFENKPTFFQAAL